jgi:hypothetical protein
MILAEPQVSCQPIDFAILCYLKCKSQRHWQDRKGVLGRLFVAT